MAGATPLSQAKGPRLGWRLDAVVWLTIYLVVLYGVPSRLVIGPLGSAGAVSMLFGLCSFGVWLLAHIGTGRRTRMHPEPVRVALALFVISVGVSYALAMSRPISPDEISPADVALLSLLSWSGALLITHDGVVTRSRMNTFVWRLAVAGGLLALLGLAQFFSGQAIVDRLKIPGLSDVGTPAAYVRGGRIRPSGTAIHPLEYGAILAILLPIALHVAFHHRTRPVVVRWLPVLAIGAVIAISSSRTAYLAADVAVLVAGIGWAWRQRLIVLGLGVAGVLGLIAVAPHLVTSVLNLFSGASNDPSVTSRTNSFPLAWSFLAEHPLFGRGLGTFLPKYRIFDDQYLLLLVTVGVVGAATFVGILVAALFGLIRGYLATQDLARRDLLASLAGALVSGFVSLAFFDAFAFPMTMGTVFLCLGLAGAAARLELKHVDNAPLQGGSREYVVGQLDGVEQPSTHQPRRPRALTHSAQTEQISQRNLARLPTSRRAAGFPDHNRKPERQHRDLAVTAAEETDSVDHQKRPLPDR